jgi:hypothetical protein
MEDIENLNDRSRYCAVSMVCVMAMFILHSVGLG